MFCPNCGAQNRDEAKFCVKCGETFGETRKEEKPLPFETKAIKNQLFDKKTGFFGTLFDFSFTEFVTSKIIKFLYGLSILCSGIAALILLIIVLVGGFKQSASAGILALLFMTPFSILLFLILVVYGRVFLEIIIVIFRIAEHTAEIAKKGQIQG